MEENKALFVQELGEFYHKFCDEQVDGLRYEKKMSEEFVVVQYRSGSRKRFCVTADSHQGILKDFVKFLNNFDCYDWEI